MGVPAYARHERHPGLVKTYEEVINEFVSEQDDSSEQKKDLKSAINELNFWKGYRFDSTSDVKKKCKYAKRKYGGVFLWEIGQDKRISDGDGGILIASASSIAHSRHMVQDENDTMEEEL
eukprot:scaffold4739_cov126-Skeletonema_menzelii.AAC.3